MCHITVRKQLDPDKPYFRMWQARTVCGKRPNLQYWDFGATLGAGLEHLRRCHASGR